MEHRDANKPRAPATGSRSARGRADDAPGPGPEEGLQFQPLDEEMVDGELQLQPLDDGALPSASLAENAADESPIDFAEIDLSEELPALETLAPVGAGVLPGEPMVAHTNSTEPDLPTEEAPAGEEIVGRRGRRKFLMTAAPSWLISLMVHLALILILAAVTLEPLQQVISVLQASASEAVADVEQFDIQGPTLDVNSLALDEPLSVPSPKLNQVVAMPELTSPIAPKLESSVDTMAMNRLTESIMPSAMLSSSAMAQMSVALNSRSSSTRSQLLERYGGNAASEKAVAMALKWIADHQANDGGWTFAHSSVCGNQCKDPGELALARNGATAMAILPFLGAGQTHVEGQYQDNVKKGLAFLINRMKVSLGDLPRGSWHEPGGRMYSHGLAAITVCEAYAMTQDPDLLQPAQLSLNYLIYAQDPQGGGWRYEPRRPGDTSVVGWCVMALKSGKMGNLVVPPISFQGASQFLDFVSANQGAYYGYDRPTSKIEGRHATTAVGLLCRMYMGWDKEHPGIQEGVRYLSKHGPRSNDLYYSYYATQVLRHHGGPEWDSWNAKMRDELIQLQEQRGHAAGSWFTGGSHSGQGGRLYATSLATMILEVYYRHMPLYSEKSSDDDFEI